MSRKRSTPKVIGYLRVGLPDQDLKEDKAAVLAFAGEHRLGRVQWVAEKVSRIKSWRQREIASVVASLGGGDWLIVPALFHLGRYTLDVLDLLAELRKKGVNVHVVRGSWTLNSTIETGNFLTLVALFGELDRELVSARTKEAVKTRKAAGLKLGRPPGPGKSRLDPYRAEIEALLRNGSRLNFIAKRYRVTVPTLVNWIRKNNIDRTPRP